MADQSETQSDSAAPERGAYEMMDMDLNQKVRLPFLSIVFMTVGNVRNRLGRSIVTLFGVVLGTAFLMAVGSSGYIRGELTQQEANRTKAADAVANIGAEMGALRGRTLALIVEHWDDLTLRLVQRLADHEDIRLQIYSPNAPEATKLGVSVDSPAQAVDNADALIICNNTLDEPGPIPSEAVNLREKIVMDLKGSYDAKELKARGLFYTNLLKGRTATLIAVTAAATVEQTETEIQKNLGELKDLTLAMIVEHSDDFTLRLIEQLADRPGMRLQIYAPNAPDAASLGHPAATPAQAVDNADALIICNRDSKVPVPIPAEAADLSKKIVMDLQGIYDSEQLKDQGFQYVNLTLIDREAQEAARTMWLIGVSLLVSGMGIANALLMSVTERFREIGTLKCLGARDGLVVELFIIESAALGLVGSIFGAVVGLLVAIVGNIATYGWATVKANLPWGDLIKFGLFSLVVGLVVAMAAAIYPAFVAARMTPADALRSDM